MDQNRIISERFNRTREMFISRDMSYKIVSNGCSRQILYENQVIKFPFIAKVEGKQIISSVKRDIENNFQPNNPDFDYGIEAKYKQSEFNPSQLRANIGRTITAIDINDCYWFTAYKLGIITHQMFIAGLRFDNWKAGRNMAIGSLATKIITNEYKGSKLINHTHVESFPGGPGLNNWVKNHVWDVFEKLISILKDDFLMYYVDCIWVTGKGMTIPDTIKYFNENGYHTKTKVFEVLSVNQTDVEILCISDDILYERWESQGADPERKPREPVRKYHFGFNFNDQEYGTDTTG